VSGYNGSANDESIHLFVGSMFSTQLGNGAAGGDMINTGEIAPRARRGIVPPLDHHVSSDGTVQNLDGDSDLEIGGSGSQFRPDGTLQQHAIVGRGDPFRVRNYEGHGAVAEFLLYRFTFEIESFLAQSLSDMTSVYFERMPGLTSIWFEDGVGKGISNGGFVYDGEPVLIRAAQTPEELALIPEPSTWALGFTGLLGAGWFARRRRRTG
jgi:hypothetical protein